MLRLPPNAAPGRLRTPDTKRSVGFDTRSSRGQIALRLGSWDVSRSCGTRMGLCDLVRRRTGLE